jgi:hypothetical protein
LRDAGALLAKGSNRCLSSRFGLAVRASGGRRRVKAACSVRFERHDLSSTTVPLGRELEGGSRLSGGTPLRGMLSLVRVVPAAAPGFCSANRRPTAWLRASRPRVVMLHWGSPPALRIRRNRGFRPGWLRLARVFKLGQEGAHQAEFEDRPRPGCRGEVQSQFTRVSSGGRTGPAARGARWFCSGRMAFDDPELEGGLRAA